jgi:hypothetical protein
MVLSILMCGHNFKYTTVFHVSVDTCTCKFPLFYYSLQNSLSDLLLTCFNITKSKMYNKIS